MFLRCIRDSINKNLRVVFQSRENLAAIFMDTTTQHVPRFAGIPGNVEPPDWYNPGGFHPVHLSDKIAHRYRVLRKLGWGTCSTVWLAVDEK